MLTEAGQIVIAAGGGGIPVMEQGIDLHGASAIIEKDFASGLLAEELNADTLLILTSVEKVSLDKGTDKRSSLELLPPRKRSATSKRTSSRKEPCFPRSRQGFPL